jgi:hypothetical protein
MREQTSEANFARVVGLIIGVKLEDLDAVAHMLREDIKLRD